MDNMTHLTSKHSCLSHNLQKKIIKVIRHVSRHSPDLRMTTSLLPQTSLMEFLMKVPEEHDHIIPTIIVLHCHIDLKKVGKIAFITVHFM